MPIPVEHDHRGAVYCRSLVRSLVLVAATILAPAESAADCKMVASRGSPDALQRNIDCLARRIEALRNDRDRLYQDMAELERRLAQSLEVVNDGVRTDADRVLRGGSRVRRGGTGAPGRTMLELHAAPARIYVSNTSPRYPASRVIERSILDSRCGDADGCLITLGLSGLHVPGTSPGQSFKSMFVRGPCIFHIDSDTGNWALSGTCVSADLPTGETETGVSVTDGGDGPRWGWGEMARVGPGTAGSGGQVVLDVAHACFIAEGKPDTRRGLDTDAGIEPDRTRDLYLIAGAPEWQALGAFPRDWIREGQPVKCWLTLRD